MYKGNNNNNNKQITHPLSPLVAAKIQSLLLQTGITIDSNELLPIEIVKVYNDKVSETALMSGINSVITKEPLPTNPTDALLQGNTLVNLNAIATPLVFGVIGSIWGNIRWTIKSFSAGLRGQELRKFVSKRNKVGSTVFMLLLIDPIAQTIMAWPTNGIRFPYIEEPVKIPIINDSIDIPSTTLIPIVASTSFIITTILAIRYRKYVVLPLSTAFLYAHANHIVDNDTLRPYINSIPYINQITDSFK